MKAFTSPINYAVGTQDDHVFIIARGTDMSIHLLLNQPNQQKPSVLSQLYKKAMATSSTQFLRKKYIYIINSINY